MSNNENGFKKIKKDIINNIISGKFYREEEKLQEIIGKIFDECNKNATKPTLKLGDFFVYLPREISDTDSDKIDLLHYVGCPENRNGDDDHSACPWVPWDSQVKEKRKDIEEKLRSQGGEKSSSIRACRAIIGEMESESQNNKRPFLTEHEKEKKYIIITRKEIDHFVKAYNETKIPDCNELKQIFGEEAKCKDFADRQTWRVGEYETKLKDDELPSNLCCFCLGNAITKLVKSDSTPEASKKKERVYLFFVGDFVCNGKDENAKNALANFLTDELRPLLRLLAPILINQVYMPAREALVRRQLQAEAAHSAHAAIMTRNMSHNIGSHVLHHLAADARRKSEYELERMYHYLAERMEFIAQYFTTKKPIVSQFVSFYDLVCDFVCHSFDENSSEDGNHWPCGQDSTNHLLSNIIRSEKFTKIDLSRNSTAASNEDATNDKALSIHLEGGENELILLMGGIMGAQAFYIILENFIRNSAKHQGHKTNHLVITIKLEDNKDDNDYYTLRLRDNVTEHSPQLEKKLNEAVNMHDLFEEDTTNIKYDSWGMKEMEICATYLAGGSTTGNNHKSPTISAGKDTSVKKFIELSFRLPKPRMVAVCCHDDKVKEINNILPRFCLASDKLDEVEDYFITIDTADQIINEGQVHRLLKWDNNKIKETETINCKNIPINLLVELYKIYLQHSNNIENINNLEFSLSRDTKSKNTNSQQESINLETKVVKRAW